MAHPITARRVVSEPTGKECGEKCFESRIGSNLDFNCQDKGPDFVLYILVDTVKKLTIEKNYKDNGNGFTETCS